MTTKFIALFLVLMVHLSSKACDCVPYEGDFCSSIVGDHPGEIIDYLSIYHIKVKSIKQGGMRVDVLQTFHGVEVSGQELFIQRGNGADCIVITDKFTINEELIVSIQALGVNWFIPECGVHYLNVSNGRVTGPITINVTEVALSQFPLLDPACGDMIISSTVEPDADIEITASPNPVKNSIEIQFPDSYVGDMNLSVYDIFGKLIYKRKHDNNRSISIQMETWLDGLYLFSFNANDSNKTLKVIKSGVRHQ